MTTNLLQQARDIAADQYIRLELKRKTPGHALVEWSRHIESYTQFMRQGHYDNSADVQCALVALRSVAA